MPVIGITGGVATGKSLVSRLLHEAGATTFSADEAARATLSPGGPTLRAIAQAFGAEMLLPDGSLDRARLAQRVFADPQARLRLEQITHPPILRLLRAQIEAAQQDLSADTIIAVEVPLLFETGLTPWFEQIVVVTASEATQIERLRTRNGLEEAEARQRIAAQWPLARKVALADYVISTENTIAEVADAVRALWTRLVPAPPPRADF